VTPFELTSKMMEAAIAAGVRLLIDSAVDAGTWQLQSSVCWRSQMRHQ
jgi:hypothetical protein